MINIILYQKKYWQISNKTTYRSQEDPSVVMGKVDDLIYFYKESQESSQDPSESESDTDTNTTPETDTFYDTQNDFKLLGELLNGS